MHSKEILYALQNGTITPEDAEKALMRIMGEGSKPETKLYELPGELRTSSVVDVSEIEPGIVQVTMADRLHKNTFSIDLIIGLMQAFHAIQLNPSYKVVVLTGYENYFACGGSQEGLMALYEGQVKMTDVNIYSLPLNCEIPVIAAMQGHAIGGGWCFGMFSDFIVMSRESSYTCNHMKYGFTPGDGATLVFPEKLGYSLAQEILFTGRKYRGAELEAKGAGMPVLPRKEVLPYAIQLARELAEVPRPALILLKAHMTDSIRKQLSGTLEKEWQMQEQTFVNKPEILQKMLATFNQPSNNRSVEKVEQSSEKQPPLLPEEKAINTEKQFPELIRLNRSVQGRPVFWLHGEGGGVEGYQVIAQNSQRPFYGLQARGRMNTQPPIRGITAMASYYLQLLRATQPEGPYDLGGYSLGGALAYEVTRQLQEVGQTVYSIVMIDALDSLGMRKVAVSNQATILQTINLSLMNRVRQEPEKLFQKLIHQREINKNLPDEELLQHLISLGKTRGLSLTKTEAELFTLFHKNIQIQQAFEVDQFSLLPLPNPQAVTCYYFRNQKGSYYGEFQPYLTSCEDEISIDHTQYWQEWEQQFPHFEMIDVDASNHVTLLFEQKPYETMSRLCKHLYRADP